MQVTEKESMKFREYLIVCILILEFPYFCSFTYLFISRVEKKIPFEYFIFNFFFMSAGLYKDIRDINIENLF